MSSLLALSGGGSSGFRQDSRFAASARRAGVMPAETAPPEPVQIEDPVAVAWAEGYARGIEQARAEAEAAMSATEEARTALELSFARLDAEMTETLRQRLQETVMALCEATLVPFALDPSILARRAERAVAMLSRADDERVIRLNPEDLALVSARLPPEWTVAPDAALERGALRVETQSGGVEDGPAQWRRALAEAFHAC